MPSPEEAGAAGESPAPGFHHLGDEQRFEGWRISLVDATFVSPDGVEFHRDVVRHPGAVAVVPLTDRSSALLVRQYRGAVDRWVLEIPAGTRDVEGEPPEVTATRELEEEVGVRAGSIERLAVVLNTPGFCDEETVLFAAGDLAQVPPARHGPEEEHLEVVEVPLDAVPDMVARGELIDAQTLLGLLMVLRRPAGWQPTAPAPAVDPA